METKATSQSEQQHGVTTRALAGFCHSCGVCRYAAKKPGSTFEHVMRWHRTWCPAWSAHTKVYGLKQLG